MRRPFFLFFARIFLLLFLSGMLFIPLNLHAQKRGCNTDVERRPKASESKGVLQIFANKNKGSRVPRPGSKSVKPAGSSLFPFIMNEPRNPLQPSDRARFYGIGVWELGINAGTAHAFSELSMKVGGDGFDTKAFLLENVSYSGGIFARNKINEWVGFALGADYAHLTAELPAGYDYTFEQGRSSVTQRVYSFANDILELSGKLELHAPAIGMSSLNFYGFAGFATFFSKPEVFDAAGLSVLSRDGAFSLALPFGGGMTFLLGNYIRVGGEIGYRYTADHGIDGVIVPANTYDSYLFSTIRIGYVLPSK